MYIVIEYVVKPVLSEVVGNFEDYEDAVIYAETLGIENGLSPEEINEMYEIREEEY